jgi:hypothetical protein
MPRQPRHPLSSHPPTSEKTDGAGQPVFTITPSELTPFRAKAADQISFVLSLGLAAMLIITLLHWRNPALPEYVFAVLIFLAGRKILRWAMREMFHVQTVIVMDINTIKVRRGLRWRPYDRTLDHQFALPFHDLTTYEQRNNDYAARKASKNGNVIQPPTYYGDSRHVVMIYAGHRVDFMSVYGPQRAANIVARLQYCDRRLDEAAKKGGSGFNPHADNDWHESPGGLGDV